MSTKRRLNPLSVVLQMPGIAVLFLFWWWIIPLGFGSIINGSFHGNDVLQWLIMAILPIISSISLNVLYLYLPSDRKSNSLDEYIVISISQVIIWVIIVAAIFAIMEIINIKNRHAGNPIVIGNIIVAFQTLVGIMLAVVTGVSRSREKTWANKRKDAQDKKRSK